MSPYLDCREGGLDDRYRGDDDKGYFKEGRAAKEISPSTLDSPEIPSLHYVTLGAQLLVWQF